MLLDNSARQQRTLIQITQVADSNELVQVTQTNLILRQNNNMVAADSLPSAASKQNGKACTTP